MSLEPGAAIDLPSLGRAVIHREIGRGGQGTVYEVVRGDRRLALKWYSRQAATRQQYDAISLLVDRGSPHPRFLWPVSLARVDGLDGFGYAMPLRPDRYHEMSFLLTRRTRQGEPLDLTFEAVLRLSRQLAESFLSLHAHGLCYRDISLGNVFFSESGDVLICDNDNVGVDNGGGLVLGTPRFMAPELVADMSGRQRPNTQTDLHSLAVLLFYALFVAHPLEGRRTDTGMRDEMWLRDHFGASPLFVLDPDDTSNAPTSDHVLRYWQTYPRFLREYVLRAFTEGLRDPYVRVTEGEWIKMLRQLRDVLMRCPDCEVTGFWDPAGAIACRSCGRPLQPGLVLNVGRHRVAVSELGEVRGHHLGARAPGTGDVATVRRHPTDRKRWGLRNDSGRSWAAQLPDGRRLALEPGRTIDLMPGLRLDLQPGNLQVVANP